MSTDGILPAPRPPQAKVVHLAGGPTMTVVDVGEKTGLVFCRWVKPDGSLAEAGFDPASLYHGSSPNCPPAG